MVEENRTEEIPPVAEPQHSTKCSTHSIINDTMIIAAFPVIAYSITFAFEDAVASRFGFTSDLICLTPMTLFQVGGHFIALLVVIVFIYFYLLRVVYQSFKGFLIILYCLFATNISLILIYRYSSIKLPWWVLPIVSILLIGLLYVDTAKSMMGIYDPNDPPSEPKPPTTGERIVREIFDRLYFRTFFILYCAGAFLFLSAQYAGNGWADAQREFYVTNYNGVEYAVLRFYGDKMVCAPYNHTTKIIVPRYVMLSLDSKVELTYKKIGPLQGPNLDKTIKHKSKNTNAKLRHK